MKELYREATTGSAYNGDWLDPAVGRKISNAADLVRRYANNTYNLNISSMSVSMLSDDFALLSKDFTVAT